MTDDLLLKFECPGCSQILQVEENAAGQVVECPRCGEHLRIPDAPEAEEPVQEASAPRQKTVTRAPSASSPAPPPLKTTPPARRRKTPYSVPGAVRKRPKSYTGIIMAVLILLIASGGGIWWFLNEADSGTGNGASVSGSDSSSGGSATGEVSAAIRPDSAEGPQALADAKSWNLQDAAKVETFQFGTSGEAREEITDVVARGDGRLVMVGVLAAPNPPDGAKTTHHLVDRQGGKEHAFVAELSPDGQTVNWFSLFGGDLLYPQCLALGPDGSIAIGGEIRDRMKSAAGPDAGEFKGRTSVVVKVAPDGSDVEWIRDGGPNQKIVEDIAVDSKGRVVFAGGTRGRGQSSYIIRINADGSGSSFPGQPEGRQWSIDFDVRGGQFLEEDQVGAFYKLAETGPDGYDYDGDGPWGPTTFSVFGIRQGGSLVLLPNDDIVAAGTLQYNFKVKGKRSFPAFDTIVARWNPDGKLIWSTNLYQEGDGVHTPDQKDKDLVYNPANGDLYVLVGQHGSNIYRFKGKLVGDTGNLFISWIGRVNPENGDLKEGWYWMNSRNSGYNDNGVPQSPPHPRLAGNGAEALGVDSRGNIYFAGNSGAKAFSTPNAWKKWPDGESGGGNASLTVLSPELDRVLYATQIYGDEHNKSSAKAMAVTSKGVWVGGRNAGRGFAHSTAPWSSPNVAGDHDAAVTRFQFD